MQIRLTKATINDCKQIHQMQVKAFESLLIKYNDKETNPGSETLERVKQRMGQIFTDYYFIELDTTKIGVIRVATNIQNVCRIAPMFILPAYRSKGYAQQAIMEAELLYPDINIWELDTIKQENKLCHLYEKMGYVITGKEERIQEGMDRSTSFDFIVWHY